MHTAAIDNLSLPSEDNVPQSVVQPDIEKLIGEVWGAVNFGGSFPCLLLESEY